MEREYNHINNSPSSSFVVIAFDATKERGEHELKLTVEGVRLRGDILRAGDKLLVLGVLHRFVHPMGYHVNVGQLFGTSIRSMEEEVAKRADAFAYMLSESAEKCEKGRVNIEVKIIAGTPIRKVILQEVLDYKPTWVILDRHLRRDLRHYEKQIQAKLAIIQDSLAVEVVRPIATIEAEPIERKQFHSFTRPVYKPMQENSDIYKTNSVSSSTSKTLDNLFQKNFMTDQDMVLPRSSDVPIVCVACGMRTELFIRDPMTFSFSDIQNATKDFSEENLLGEGGYGHVYKGELKDGQMIAAKVRKEESSQGFSEFHSEIYVLSFARHKNIVMLLGFCCKENLNILVYEYICNQSLHWHLFENTSTFLEWHQRHAIAIGTAKGLRFLHEECRGGPIIHRDVRPSNILLTHDFVPMIGDFGLAKWNTTSDDSVQTKILGTIGYLAPEYAENGIVSVRTDVYSFGIVLLQLISGRKVIDSQREEQQLLRQWAEPLIEKLALHELIDPRIGDSYDTYQLYLMAKTAFLCIQRNPEMRPSMAEVVRLLEGENDRFGQLGEQFVPHHRPKQ